MYKKLTEIIVIHFFYQDMGKCIKQILHCYSLNRRSMNPMQLYITNLNGKCEKEMEKHTGYRNWDVSNLETCLDLLSLFLRNTNFFLMTGFSSILKL